MTSTLGGFPKPVRIERIVGGWCWLPVMNSLFDFMVISTPHPWDIFGLYYPRRVFESQPKKLFMEKHPAPLRMRQKLGKSPTLKIVWGIPSGFFPDFCPSTKFTKNAGDQWGSSSLLLPAGEFLGPLGQVGLFRGGRFRGGFLGGRRANWLERYFLIHCTEDPCEISSVF